MPKKQRIAIPIRSSHDQRTTSMKARLQNQMFFTSSVEEEIDELAREISKIKKNDPNDPRIVRLQQSNALDLNNKEVRHYIKMVFKTSLETTALCNEVFPLYQQLDPNSPLAKQITKTVKVKNFHLSFKELTVMKNLILSELAKVNKEKAMEQSDVQTMPPIAIEASDPLVALKKIYQMVYEDADQIPTKKEIDALKQAPHDEKFIECLRKGIIGTKERRWSQEYLISLYRYGVYQALWNNAVPSKWDFSENKSFSLDKMYHTMVHNLLQSAKNPQPTRCSSTLFTSKGTSKVVADNNHTSQMIYKTIKKN